MSGLSGVQSTHWGFQGEQSNARSTPAGTSGTERTYRSSIGGEHLTYTYDSVGRNNRSATSSRRRRTEQAYDRASGGGSSFASASRAGSRPTSFTSGGYTSRRRERSPSYTPDNRRAPSATEKKFDIDITQLGTSMPFSVRAAAELIALRDGWALEESSNILKTAMIEVGLAVTLVASIVEGVARTFFAVILLPAVCTDIGSRFYTRCLVGMNLNLIAIPEIVKALVTNWTTPLIYTRTVLGTSDTYFAPWISAIEGEKKREEFIKDIAKENKIPTTVNERKELLAKLSQVMDFIRGNRNLLEFLEKN